MSNELSAARVNKAKGAMDTNPLDLLRAMIHDIETGKVTVDGIAIIWAHRPQEGVWDYGTYRAGFTADQELVALTLAVDRCKRGWIGG